MLCLVYIIARSCRRVNRLVKSQGAHDLKRVNKGMKRMNSLPLSPAVFSHANLQGKPLPTSPAEQCSTKLIPRPFRTLQFTLIFTPIS